MKTEVQENWDKLEGLKERQKTMPSGDVAANLRKRISDIRDLLIKADTALEAKRSPAKYVHIVELILNDLEYEDD